MEKLKRQDLYSLEDYDQRRPEFRAKVMAHKRNRMVRIGKHVGLYFEDRLTMHYQIQEMLRAERIFEAEGIQDELDAYNPLIPDGSNLKATFMIEVPDVDERRRVLSKLKGIENETWLRVDGFEPVFAIADEDLERENAEKTSSVHFMRFELTSEMIEAAKGGVEINMGADHDNLTVTQAPIPRNVRDSLVADFD